MQWELSIFLKLITLEMSFFKIRKFIHREKSSAAFAPTVLDLKSLFCGQSRRKFGSSLSAGVSEHNDHRLRPASSCLQQDLC